MLSPKNASTRPLGTWGALLATAGSIPTETAKRPTKATNHGMASRAPTNRRAPSGDVNAQSETPDDVLKPPRLHCKANGSRRLIQSWVRRNSRKRRVRAKVERLTAEASR